MSTTCPTCGIVNVDRESIWKIRFQKMTDGRNESRGEAKRLREALAELVDDAAHVVGLGQGSGRSSPFPLFDSDVASLADSVAAAREALRGGEQCVESAWEAAKKVLS